MTYQPPEFSSAKLVALAAHPAEDGRTLLDVLVDDFLSTAPALLAELEFQAEKRNIEGVTEHAEALRSPALTLGLMKVASICADVGAANAFTPDVAAQVRNLRAAFDRAVAWLKTPDISEAV